VTRRILLSGRPGCGKTTLIQRVVKNLTEPAGGFYTKEIRKRGRRVGFKLVTLDGKEAVFADINFPAAAGSDRVGKYGLDLSKLETVGVAAVRDAMHSRQIVVIDEIGPMEIRSAAFRDAVNEAFDSDSPILATVVARSLPFPDSVKGRSDVSVIDVRPDNRDRLVRELLDRFKI
jgi:nucleoside-triphosphatase